MPDRTYRCLNCLDHTLVRPFDVSHLSITCPVCEEFQRFVNDDVLDQFEAFEADPPENLDWAQLERTEKLMVSDQVVRTSRTVDDFSLERGDPDSEPDDADSPEDGPTDDQSGNAEARPESDAGGDASHDSAK